jgi:hypothetical protein
MARRRKPQGASQHYLGYYDGHLMAAAVYNKHAGMPAVDLEVLFSPKKAVAKECSSCQDTTSVVYCMAQGQAS